MNGGNPFTRGTYISPQFAFNCFEVYFKYLTILFVNYNSIKLRGKIHIDGSPPGSPIPGILQARTLEWAAISFSNA